MGNLKKLKKNKNKKLAGIYEKGLSLYLDFDETDNGLRYLLQAAKGGYKKAYGEVGIIFYIEKNDTEKAEKWFKKAEKTNALFPAAAYEYGMLHYLHKNKWETGLEYLLQAAEQEYCPAYGDIGCILYLYKNDIDNAVKWFTKAEETDCLYPPAAFYYGLLLKLETDDPYKCIKYYRMAADGEYEEAYGELGSAMYFQDKFDEAEMWFKKAEDADCMSPPNAYTYGMFLIEERDDVEKGNYFLDKAAVGGFE